MENGKVKARGIEVRRRDTPKFVFDAQTDIIKVLSTTNNVEELYKKMPQALNVVKAYREKLLNNEISIWDLVITKHLSKKTRRLPTKRQPSHRARQLIKEGDEVNSGDNVQFIFTNAEKKLHDRRVRAKELIDDSTSPDKRKYLKILYDSSANLLSFAGYTAKSINEVVRGQRQNNLWVYYKKESELHG